MGSNEKSAMKLTYRQTRTENRGLETGNKVAAIFEGYGDQSNRRDIDRKHWGGCCRWRFFQRPANAQNCCVDAIIDRLIGKHERTGLLEKFNPKQGQPNKKKQVGDESARHSTYSSNKEFNILSSAVRSRSNPWEGDAAGLSRTRVTHHEATRLTVALVMPFVAGGVSLEHVADHGAGKLVLA